MALHSIGTSNRSSGCAAYALSAVKSFQDIQCIEVPREEAWHSINAAKVESIMTYLDGVIAEDPRVVSAAPTADLLSIVCGSCVDSHSANGNHQLSLQTDALPLSTSACANGDSPSSAPCPCSAMPCRLLSIAPTEVGESSREASEHPTGLVRLSSATGACEVLGMSSSRLAASSSNREIERGPDLGLAMLANRDANEQSTTRLRKARPEHAVYNSIKSRIDSLRFENSQLKRDNEELRSVVVGLRGAEREHLEGIQRAATVEVEALRDEVKSATQRYSRKVAQLQSDKDRLTAAVEALKSQVMEEQRLRENERAKMEAAHAAALSASRAKWVANEKALREKWKEAESKKIKESTLRSLEPDIALLISRHKAEKARMNDEFQSELQRRDEVAAAGERAVAEQKAKLARETEEFMARERAVYRERLAEETERVRQQIEDDRRVQRQKMESIEAFHAEQCESLQHELRRVQQQLFTLKSVSTREQATLHEAVTMEVAGITAESNAQLRQLKERLLHDFEERERAFGLQNAEYLAVKEAELRRRCEAERDHAIAAAVQRIEEERVRAVTTTSEHGELLREKYLRLEQEVERLRTELVVVNTQLKAALDTVAQRDGEMAAYRRDATTVAKAAAAVEERVRGEMETAMRTLDSEWQQKLRQFEIKHVDEVLEAQHALTKARKEWERERDTLRHEIVAVGQKHNAELSTITNQMVVALSKKDNTIRLLQEQNVVVQDALESHEMELERHRLLLLQ